MPRSVLQDVVDIINQRTESKGTNSSHHSLQVQYLNNGSYGENLSSTTGPAKPIAQYFFKFLPLEGIQMS